MRVLHQNDFISNDLIINKHSKEWDPHSKAPDSTQKSHNSVITGKPTMGVGYKMKHLRFEVQQIDTAEPTKEIFGTSPIHNVATSHQKFGSKRKSSTPLGPCKNLKMQKERDQQPTKIMFL